MKVESLSRIDRVPLAVEYRRMYRATAELSVANRSLTPTRVEFVLELSPYGFSDVSIRFLERTDFPVLPAIPLLREHVRTLDRDGHLP